jgi:hypothetical protein
MPDRKLRIVKEIAGVPVLGICEHCTKQFPADPPLIGQLTEARASIDEQFNAHVCKLEDASQAAVRIVKDATENH